MKTQISRNSFSANKRFSSISQQMGRMITDADWNELSELVRFQLFDSLQDVIGSGSPRDRGMVFPVDDTTWALRWGYLYVDGIKAKVVPNLDVYTPEFQFSQQLDFPAAPPLTAGSHRLYADVWERTVTHLEDSSLIDPGLKGADTCTRSQTMAQIKSCSTDLSQEDIANETLNPSIGNIAVNLSIRAGSTVADPCDPCAEVLALQDEVGNYLFRIEIHDVIWSDDAEPKIESITFKWSSENGAEQYQVGATPPAFESDQWCYEFFSGPSETNALNMTTEKHLGHHLAQGFSPARGELYSGYPDAEPADLPLVRRWDGFISLTQSDSGWTITGADKSKALSLGYGDTDHGYVSLSGTGDSTVSINLNATVVSFNLHEKRALAGDYWQATVRQVVNNDEPKLLVDALPIGIKHHYLLLGDIQINAEGGIESFSPADLDVCKAFDFPSLTDIKAKDVCYNNDACDMPEVKTVQDAIDYLCREKDLRWHNKHLHGMGVVCGLKVQCGPDTYLDPTADSPTKRRHVTVTDGYAIGCEGDDLVLEGNTDVDILEAIEKLDSDVLDEAGDGSVCLYIDLDDGAKPALRIAAYNPDEHDKGIFDGTIWLDFYEHCIKDIIADIRAALGNLDFDDIEKDEAKNDELISAQRKKLVALINLAVYFFYQPHGKAVFTSHKEYVMLREFYAELRGILQSKTFCGMFQDQDFPAYPFEEEGFATTLFGKNHHKQTLVHPEGRYFVTFDGADTSINVFDSNSGTMIFETNAPSAQGGQTTALTFTENGDIYAAIDVNTTDTILSRGRFEDGKISWETSAVICGVFIAHLQFDPTNPKILYAVGKGDGLYVLNLDTVFGSDHTFPAPIYMFSAVGQVAYDFEKRMLYATANSNVTDDPLFYDSVAIIELDKALSLASEDRDAPETANIFLLLDEAGNKYSGEDDIAVSSNNGDSQVYVVVDGNNSDKEILIYNSPKPADVVLPNSKISKLADTEISLAYHNNSNLLLVALEDEFRIQAYRGTTPVIERIPVQIMPTDVVVNNKTGDIIALNYAVNTISLIPEKYMQFTAANIKALEEFRYAMVMAYFALFGNLLQKLKDCFCHLLLVKCTDCTVDQKVWLANITIKDGEVYKICNIGKRKEVVTFPKIEYWMSIVPILPLIKTGISKLCCMVLPNIFASQLEKYTASEKNDNGAATVGKAYAPITGKTYKMASTKAKKTDVRTLIRENSQNLGLSAKLATDNLVYTQKVAPAAIDKQALRYAKTPDAIAQLENKGMQVQVQEYREDQANIALQQYRQTPKNIPANSKVTVYQQKGRVVFYAVEATNTNTLAVDDSQFSELEARKAQLADMNSINESLAVAEARKQSVKEVAEVQLQLDTLQAEKAKAKDEIAILNEQLTTIKAERSIAQSDMLAMQTGVSELNTNLQTLKVEIAKERPVSDVTDVDSNTQQLLKDEGILTVNDLSKTDTQVLENKGIDSTTALKMINEAKSKTTLTL